jgi:hypothetical protein
MKLGTNSDDVMRTGHEHLSRMRLLYMHAFLSTWNIIICITELIRIFLSISCQCIYSLINIHFFEETKEDISKRYFQTKDPAN